MMKNNLIIAILLVTFASACKKVTCGCTVKEDAINYDKNAEADDGSCIFRTKIHLLPDSVEKYPVEIYIDGIKKETIRKLKYTKEYGMVAYVEKFPSNEIHRYIVVDTTGRIWKDSFQTARTINQITTIKLTR